MATTMRFNGYLKLKIREAVNLQPTRWSQRHSVFKKPSNLLDPYIAVNVDECRIGQTSIKHRTNKPTFNEEFDINVNDGNKLELLVFHDTPIGYDDFVANCNISFADLHEKMRAKDKFEDWVSHVVIYHVLM
ncbi:hypothetical protein NDU88_005185 [Pleurodeles waltl]|uniref:C2 domain-containing protein n=1 Tax=Pleurodeles waltl TaxID=8319 RepID=A0AAV7MVM9_PLEWA|nr:hypothetical protein NDU88_005185 [Pleurodeles waltl]